MGLLAVRFDATSHDPASGGSIALGGNRGMVVAALDRATGLVGEYKYNGGVEIYPTPTSAAHRTPVHDAGRWLCTLAGMVDSVHE
jgi:hypothetical protein